MPTDLVGRTLGQFEIVEPLGKGGMATVYKAYQPNLQRHVAIKVLAPALAQDEEIVRRFLREAQAAAALHHPNVIVIHDVGSEDEIHYIVAEYLEGLTLAQLLKTSGPRRDELPAGRDELPVTPDELPVAREAVPTGPAALPPARAAHIIRQVANALDYAHSRGFIHRDIKPSNIMVDPTRDDHVTLMDFGLVQVAGGSRITRSGYIMGTPDYMSPEQARGDAVDRRTDIYSLGVTTYHMLAGNVPFDKPTPHAVLMAHILEEPPALCCPGRETPQEVEAVVLKSMAKDPQDRYAWAGDMAGDIETAISTPVAASVPWAAGALGTARSLAPTSALGQAIPTTPPTGTTQPPAPPPGAPAAPAYVPAARTARRKWIWPVVGLAALVVLLSLVLLAIVAGPSIVARISPAGRAGTLSASTLVLTPATPVETPATPVETPATVAPTATVAPATPAPATPVPAPVIHHFAVSPPEIRAGEEVILEWQVSGVESVSIEPGVERDAPPSGSVALRPARTTGYELVLPNGERRGQEVRVLPARRAPVIEFFEVAPREQVRGADVELAWRVSGETTGIEVNTGFETIPDLPAEGRIPVIAEQTTLFVLTAYNGELSASESVRLTVLDPAPEPTELPPPTEPPPPAPTEPPPSPTPTEPPAPTEPAPTEPPPAPAPAAPEGVLTSFETWGAWTRGDQPFGELEQTQEQVRSGNYAARLSYDFPESDEDFVVFRQTRAIGGTRNALSVWVYGDGSGHLLNLWVQDAENEVWSVHMGEVGPEGWQQMTGVIDAGRPWPSGHVYGPDNGTIDYPIRFYAIVLDRPGAGPLGGRIYLDDIAALQVEVPAPQPGEPPGPPPPGAEGRIVFTVLVGESFALYATDPGWDTMVKIGDTDEVHSTCTDGPVATTLTGTTIPLRPFEHCPIAGTVDSCLSPDGQYKVNTNRQGGDYQVTLWRTGDNVMLEAIYTGKLNIHPGLNWAPDSSHFMFTVDHSVYRADVDQVGYRLIIPFKHDTWPLQYTPDGGHVFYPKPVNGPIVDIFLARPDGSQERNLTHSPIAVKLCPRWRE